MVFAGIKKDKERAPLRLYRFYLGRFHTHLLSPVGRRILIRRAFYLEILSRH